MRRNLGYHQAREAYQDEASALRQTLFEEPLTYREFCNILKVPDGDLKGQPFNPDLHPAQRETVAALDRGYRKIVQLKPVQDGGTLVALMPMLKRAIREAQTCLLAYPTEELAKDIWATKVWPILEAFGGQQPKRGGGSKGGASRHVKLPGGGQFMLRKAGGRKESAQAAVSGDALLVDEVDDWPSRHRVNLVSERLNRATDPLLSFVSTLKRDSGSIILGMYEDSACTQSHMRYPCAYCGALNDMLWEHVDVERRVYVCPDCEKDWSEQDRLTSLDKAIRYDERPAAPAFSMRWNALESPFPVQVEGRKLPVIQGLCALYLSAKEKAEQGEHGPLRSFYRDRLTLPYTKDMVDTDEHPTMITCGRLAARSKVSTYALDLGREVHKEDGDSIHIAQKPPEVEFLVMTQDVQRGGLSAPGRNYFLLQGWSADRRSWDLAWGHLVACPKGKAPSEAELHACLDRVHALGQELATGYGLPLLRRGVDCADRMTEIRRWLQRHQDWWAIRGVESTRKAQEGDIQGCLYRRKQETGWMLYEIDVHEMRQRAQNGFLVDPGKPGAAHLPEGLSISSAIIMHYCATALIPDGRNGLRWSDRKEDRRYHGDWQTRHDFLDCRTYACALAEYQIKSFVVRKIGPRKYGNVGNVFG